MGNVIVRASHVGATTTSGNKYPLPATDYEMEIAKRAARHTQARWKQEKEQDSGRGTEKQKQKKTDSNFKSRSKVRPSPTKKEKLRPTSSVNKAAKKARADQPSRATESSISDQRSEAAKKLGITEVELARRVSALKVWHSLEGRAS